MKRASSFIMIVSLELLTLSCRNAIREEEKEDYEFYYYPEKNVYYDVEKKSFFYSLDGAKTWDSIMSTSNKEPATLGEKVIIYSPDNHIYKDNPGHRKLYNGNLYDIPDGLSASAAPEVTERKITKKSVTGTKQKPAEDKPKRGLKKFLEKIFGKHDKKLKVEDSTHQ